MKRSSSGGKTRSARGFHDRAGSTPDLIVTGAVVWTGDEARPEAEAVAIVGTRIASVGSSAQIESQRGPRTQVIEAGGRLVLPGFNDAHVHFMDGSMQLDNVDLKGAAGLSEFVRRVKAQANLAAPGEWILGGRWDEKAWHPPVLPTRQAIDAATPENPVLIHRCDMHAALANSFALRLAGITAATPDPIGGAIVRDDRGEPTGVLKDAAIRLIVRTIPSATPERRLRAAKRGLEHAASVGVTSVQHMNPTSADVALYKELAERGDLTLRIYAAPLEYEWVPQATAVNRQEFGAHTLRFGALKGFGDGSLGSATAYFFEPYADIPASRGLLTEEMQPRAAMLERLLHADEAGIQLCLHGIGDQAISLILDLYEDIVLAHGPRDRRLRIEHAQHVSPKDFERFARLDVIASVQPYHVIDDGCWAEERIGPQRLKTSYPYRTFLDNRVRIALGTDWYVAPLDPMLTLYAATTRATLDGRHPDGWVPDQKLTMAEAVSAYTMGSAYAEYQEMEKGSITPGKLADIVVLSDNIFQVDPAQACDVKVDATIMGGKLVYSRFLGNPGNTLAARVGKRP